MNAQPWERTERQRLLTIHFYYLILIASTAALFVTGPAAMLILTQIR